ncbi:uncharacterized protein LOC132786982 [Drosophila nasuta]|uniref:uncharacterized protein LOC132786982 n=1 Tax=Drosophila nasuta TaxID=42062 RepID=UPI00295E8601|nr:uncharacterized protein LOC132786982 [Drosophila nasuta]
MSSISNVQPSWLEWVNRNALPKQRYSPGPRMEPTRWQKAGPMSRQQWVNFYKWVETNGGVNYQRSIEKPKRKSRTFIPGVFFCVEPKEKERQEKKKRLQEKFDDLSVPRYKRDKFIAPPPKPFPFRPQIDYRRPQKKPERGRPWPMPIVPCCFQHEDVKAAFWANLRFPISRNALRAKPTQKIIELAQPRVYPPKPHCPIPIDWENMPRKRTKMTLNQWRMHLSRLEYLARPNRRVLAELEICRCCRCKNRMLSQRTDSMYSNSVGY